MNFTEQELMNLGTCLISGIALGASVDEIMPLLERIKDEHIRIEKENKVFEGVDFNVVN